MSQDFFPERNVLWELMSLINTGRVFSDVHIEQDMPIMIKTPRGWVETSPEPVELRDMVPVLESIDEDWEDKIITAAIDRSRALTNCRLRCNAYRLASGEKVAISIRKLPLHPLPIEKTGLPLYVKTMLEATKGIILVTGPTGSGKTTTIASMLQHLNTHRNGHIVTIEEPIEYILERNLSIISQKEVPTDTESFASGLREGLRQKPDVLMLGEIRDFNAADTVLHAGESGHLMMATMHTNSALGAISKFLSFFPSNEYSQRSAALANSLVGVIYQNLLPSEDGESFVLASEMIFNQNQQVAPFISDPGKLHMITDFIKRKEDNLSRGLNEVLAKMVSKNQVSSKDAMRATYNRLELHEMMNSPR
ncbi:type IV pilus twitching motility protein PilT [Janthinobacterium agaricidamnosum]|uniref:Type II/IV secretion system family protein n=1 Tax=Janthinobacterium agaricidamnosum NBRC 102515 = DSM 9628 TaxID=1349767 RepID=W0V372_9BURK|nr:ATPase, T2SS/T4P/T4SS family [Janthinobacterium agaricidamnosum]CDG82321.1 type II/IV secretion system family protein [Janthinobacterium agaricidamnosum NBRC 102515 = DSM 9628]